MKKSLSANVIPFFLFLILSGTGSFLYGERSCIISVQTKLPSNPIVDIKQCAFAGNLQHTGIHTLGKFVLDLHTLETGIYRFDEAMKSYFKHDRYAVLHVLPFDKNDKTFKGLLRFNGISKIIRFHIIENRNGRLLATFKVNMKQFGYSEGVAWELFDKEISISIRIIDDVKAKSDRLLKRKPER